MLLEVPMAYISRFVIELDLAWLFSIVIILCCATIELFDLSVLVLWSADGMHRPHHTLVTYVALKL